jgi:hypothetical protein
MLAHLNQAHGKREQQTQQADDAINALQWSLFDTTAAFKALVTVLYQW